MHNQEAIAQVVEALRSLGRLETVDEALVAAAESLAVQVDAHPESASLWREYRAAEASLRLAGRVANVDAFQQLLVDLSAAVGDVEDEPPVVGASGGGDSGAVGAAVDAVAAPRRRRRSGDRSK